MARPSFPPDLTETYQPERLLGRGAMGAVYLAHERSLERPVAIKIQEHPGSAEATERFLREGRLLARVEHPHVLRVYSVGTCSQGPYLALEYLEGSTLDAVDRELPVPALMLDLAGGLEAVHAAGILHRDLKPANVVVTPAGRAVLVDFGLARGDDAQALTATGHVVGTIAFMAPELLRGEPATPASDWYAWGVTLYALLEGRTPFGTVDVAAAMQGDPISAPRFSRIPESSAMAATLRALMANDPARRPAGRAALEARLTGDPLAARGAGMRNPRATLETIATSAPVALPSPGPPPAPRPGRRGPLVAAALALGALGLVVTRPPPAASPPPDRLEASRQEELMAARRDLAARLDDLERALAACDAWRSDPLDLPPVDVQDAPPILLGPLGRVAGRLQTWRLRGGDLAASDADTTALRGRLAVALEQVSLQVRGIRQLAGIVTDHMTGLAARGARLEARPPSWDYALGGTLSSDWTAIHARLGELLVVLGLPQEPEPRDAHDRALMAWFDDHPAGFQVLRHGIPAEPVAQSLADRTGQLLTDLLSRIDETREPQDLEHRAAVAARLLSLSLWRDCEVGADPTALFDRLGATVDSLVLNVRRLPLPARRELLRILLARTRTAPWRSAHGPRAGCLVPTAAPWLTRLAEEVRVVHQGVEDLTLLNQSCSPPPESAVIRDALRPACPRYGETP